MRQRAIRQHVFAPDDRIAQDEDPLRVGHLAEAAAIEPVIVAEFVRDAVVGSGVETLDLWPDARSHERDQEHHHEAEDPLARGEPHFVGAEGSFGTSR